MAVGVLRVLGLNIPSLNTENPTDAKREKEALGRMTCTEFQENAGTALPRDTAVCHSGIAGDFTTAAQERVEGGDGAQSLLATPG